MKKQKTLLSLFLLFWSMTTLFSQDNLKDLICIVKPQYPAGTKEIYEEYGRALARDGYIKAGALLRMEANGGFGSGVVIKHDGKYYVLTNFHVIEHARSASLEFRTNSDENKQIKECKIVAKDKDYDLALIALPSDSGIQSGFTFSDISLKEGTEVWSGGFPGLGNKPSWQLGKGIVSNESFKDSTLSNAKIPYVIQHTAQVDAGSSGGALLIASSSEKSGYSVVGINTWKAGGRESVNFAIPAGAVSAFLKSIQTNESIGDSKRKVETRTKELIASKNDDGYKTTLPFIGEDYMFSIPASTFMEMFADASKDAKDDAVKALRKPAPFDAFRIIVADAVHKKLKKTELVYTGTKEDSDKIISNVTAKGKEAEMTWTPESGEWFLINTSGLDMKTSANNSYATRGWEEIDRAIYVGIGFPFGDDEKNKYTLGFERRHAKWFALFYELSLGKKVAKTEEPDEKGQMQPATVSLGYFGFSFGPHFQVPLKFGPVYTIPFVKVPIGVNLGSEATDIHIGAGPGVRFAFQLGKKDKFLFLDAEYRYRYAFKQSESYKLPDSVSGFGLSLGYAF